MSLSHGLPKPGDLVGSKYRIMSSIGAGGMGVVYEAVHIETEAAVALKWLSPSLSSSPAAVERFKFEARATGRIRHPNVVAIHDISEHNRNIYLVMELLRGCSLRTRLSQSTCTLKEALQILFPIMRGVAAAHAVQVLHRDIKPENIFLAESPDGLEPIPKVLDFGIAKLSAESTVAAKVSVPTAFMGTYPYMSFEQLHGHKDLDARVDVYALGAVLYNMLTGRLPFEAKNAVDLALRMLQGDPEPVTTYARALPEGIVPVINRALARERNERYASVDEFAAALEPWADSLRYRGTGRTGPIVVHEPPPGLQATDSARPISALPTPYVVSDRPATTPVRSRPPRRSRSRAAPKWPLYAAAAATVLVLAFVVVKLVTGGASVAERKIHAPPPLPSLPVVPKQPAVTAAAAPAVENADWGAAEPEGEPPVELRPSEALPPSEPPRPAAPVEVSKAASERPTASRDRPKSEAETPRESTRRRDSAQAKSAAPQRDESGLLVPDWARTEKPARRARSSQ